MNRLILLIGLLTAKLTLSAQGLNGEISFNDSYNQTVKALAVNGSYSWIVVQQLEISIFHTVCYLNKIDTTGQIIQNRIILIDNADFTDVTHMIPTADEGVVLLAHAFPTCDVSSECFWFVQKYDSQANLEWTKRWDDFECYAAQMEGLSASQDGDFFVHHSFEETKKLYTLSPEGILTDSIPIEPAQADGIKKLSNDSFILFQEESLWLIDEIGNTVSHLVFNSEINSIELFNNLVYILRTDSILVYDNQLQEIQANHLPSFSNYSNLKVDANGIRFISHNSTEQHIIHLDFNLDLFNTLNLPVTLPINVFKDFSESHFSCAIDYQLAHFQSVRHLDFSLQSDEIQEINTTDIGISSINLTEIIVNTISPPIYQVSISANVIVKNYGDQLLNECRISHIISPFGMCQPDVFTTQINDLNLAPGDSLEISLGLIQETNVFLPGDTLTKNICVYTSHPNYKTDLNITNDEYCERFVLGYAGLESVISAEDVILFPQPAKDEIFIQSGDEYQFSIYTIGGKLLDQGITNDHSINISQLKPGFYLLRLQSIGKQNSAITKKLIKS
ncbi:MAG: T9SS type A sorting domain-containing protein [Bacteroidia bacterium]